MWSNTVLCFWFKLDGPESEFGDVRFCGGTKTGEPMQRKTHGARREPTTNATYI